jgi:hypothetical protein
MAEHQPVLQLALHPDQDVSPPHFLIDTIITPYYFSN